MIEVRRIVSWIVTLWLQARLQSALVAFLGRNLSQYEADLVVHPRYRRHFH